MTPDELKKWLTENLAIRVTSDSGHNGNNDVSVGLYINGDSKPFSSVHIFIP